MPSDLISTFERNQARGLKATINNPRVGETAKEHAQQRLDEMSYQPEEIDYKGAEALAKDVPAVIQQVRIEDPPATNIQTGSPMPTTQADELDEIDQAVMQGKKQTNMLRGYKAVLTNPNVSEEAKEHAEQLLQKHDAL